MGQVVAALDYHERDGRQRTAIVATDGHPVWSESDGAWVAAAEVEVGDLLEGPDGSDVAVVAVAQDETVRRVYNLSVAGLQTFFVVAGDEGVLVHNCFSGKIRDTKGLRHSFGKHAAEWYGRPVREETHLEDWTQLIERASQSHKTFSWDTSGAPTIAHFSRIDGKPFLVQFYVSGNQAGELATAFIPNQKQLSAIYQILKEP